MSVNGAMTIFRALWRGHRLLAGILVLEYALTFAIVLSAAAVAHARLLAVSAHSGVDEGGLFVIEASSGFAPLHRADREQAVLRLQRVVPAGAIALGSAVPFFGRNSTRLPARVDPGEAVDVEVYHGSRPFLQVLGARIVRGRGFEVGEAASGTDDRGEARVAVVSEPLARRLFHGRSALGRQFALGATTYTVVGLCEALAAPQYSGEVSTDYTVVLPGATTRPGVADVILARSGDRAALERAIGQINAAMAGRVSWSLEPYREIKADYFRSDRLALTGLLASCAAVWLTSLCGVLGLTRYWITRRRRQIAIRRALGANRRQVYTHFVSESAALVFTGLIIGLVLALAAASWTGLTRDDSLTASSLVAATLATAGLALASVCLSLQPLLHVPPAELARTT